MRRAQKRSWSCRRLVPFFKNLPDNEKERARSALEKHFSALADQLGDRPFLLGDRMTIVDPYLFWWLRSAPVGGIEVPESLHALLVRMGNMPSIRKALAEEGLA